MIVFQSLSKTASLCLTAGSSPFFFFALSPEFRIYVRFLKLFPCREHEVSAHGGQTTLCCSSCSKVTSSFVRGHIFLLQVKVEAIEAERKFTGRTRLQINLGLVILECRHTRTDWSPFICWHGILNTLIMLGWL